MHTHFDDTCDDPYYIIYVFQFPPKSDETAKSPPGRGQGGKRTRGRIDELRCCFTDSQSSAAADRRPSP